VTTLGPRKGDRPPDEALDLERMPVTLGADVGRCLSYRAGVKVAVHGQGTPAWPGFGALSTAN
jgi:hypothetical protein